MHHSNEYDPAMMEKLNGMREELEDVVAGLKAEEMGATGRFPRGKLTELDQGEVRFRVAYVDGTVVLDFGKPTAWVGMTPKQAKELAVALKRHASPVSR